jgi:hypothetical protein
MPSAGAALAHQRHVTLAMTAATLARERHRVPGSPDHGVRHSVVHEHEPEQLPGGLALEAAADLGIGLLPGRRAPACPSLRPRSTSAHIAGAADRSNRRYTTIGSTLHAQPCIAPSHRKRADLMAALRAAPHVIQRLTPSGALNGCTTNGSAQALQLSHRLRHWQGRGRGGPHWQASTQAAVGMGDLDHEADIGARCSVE